MPLSFSDKAARLNAAPGSLAQADGIHCPLCGDKGRIFRVDADGCLYARDCSCMETRRSLRLLKRSGLEDLVAGCTFKAFQTPDAFTLRAKEAALDYLQNGEGRWFYISGRPGVGKTHLCTAVCRRLIGQNIPVRYLLWRETAPALKTLVHTDGERYAAQLGELSDVPVLYIDDFLKGSVTAADLNLAFTLLNARYNRQKTRTLISSELSVAELRRLDEATGSRIRQRAEGYILSAPAGAVNWRDR